MTSTRKLLISGAHGFVAGSVMAQAGPDWEVHAVSRGEPLSRRAGLHWHRLDMLAPGLLARLFDEVRPQVVIHTAALADIDYCQAHPEFARQVNVGLTQTLAGLCAQSRAKLVFCSTDTIFDGEHAPYQEEDPAGPLNFYAQTKVQAEQSVTGLGAQGVIARLALVVGLPVLGSGNSFLARMIAALKAGRQVAVPANEIRTPVDVITLGRALLELAGDAPRGIFHLAGNDRLNRLDLAQRIAASLGFPTSLIVAQDPSTIPDRAPRPHDVSLDNRKARAQLKTPMRSLDEALSLCLRTEPAPTL